MNTSEYKFAICVVLNSFRISEDSPRKPKKKVAVDETAAKRMQLRKEREQFRKALVDIIL